MDKYPILLSIYRITIGVLVLLTVSHYYFNTIERTLVFSVSTVILLTLYFLLHKFRYIKLFSWLICISLYVGITIYSLQRSGIVAPGTHWYIIVVLLASFLLDKKAIVFWSTLIFMSLLVMYFYEDQVVINQIGDTKWWYIVSVTGLLTICLFVVGVYQNEVLRINKKLNDLNKDLEFQRKLLSDQATTITEQFEEIRASHDQLETANLILNRKKEKIGEVLKAMYQITNRGEVYEGDLTKVKELIIQYIKDYLIVDRVTFWEYDKLEETLFLTEDTNYNSYKNILTKVKKAENRDYFDFLRGNEVLNAQDIRKNQILLNVKKKSLSNYPYSALLDCPILGDKGEIKGVICCESVEKREWLDEEILLLKAFADTYLIALKAAQRKEANQQLINKQLEIAELNSNLETLVYERTERIREMNKKLTKYAFINAHKIRGPLCRLLGLQILLQMDSDLKPEQIKNHMVASLKELDEVTKMASKILEDDELVISK
ncbi:GAF domain-containing protein [Marinigracilibium pacificum]|uniref:GAF domain-containing protein n=1 Tax=Marinigracilibium pacificum TaxID=2729599 RepID=A0A848IUR5_9BACT|nr:GAF domain-containing protein [Marinigracilibium pacificum]NMM48243.1 GAF domain-containing protein [Marinigracilibium pacificum]